MNSQAESLRAFVGLRTAEPWRASDDRVILVAGARGGSGASLIAAGIALAAAGEGRRTLLVDGNEEVGALHHLLGVTPQVGLGALRGGTRDPHAAVGAVAGPLDLLAGGPGKEGAERGSAPPFAPGERRAVFRRVAQLYRNYDVVVLDAGASLDGVIAAGMPGLRRCLAVTGAEPAAVASAYAMLKAIDATWPGAPVDLVVNRHDDVHARTVFDQVQHAAGRFLARAVSFGGAVPHDDGLQAALIAGQPLVEAATGTTAAVAIDAIASRLMQELDHHARRSMAPFRPIRRP
ncbi:MAG: hypothetical protein HYX65_10430 [Gemmatimonadetes bacterium]|nr:hypothetical protein [Gemmatimonadota bacterium]